MSSTSSLPDSLNILVVDDEEPIRQILEALLVETGHRVGLANDGRDAFGKFQAEPWDVVLTDRQMPTMGGEELARLLKERSPQTPVIMVTGVPPANGCADVDAIVVKPFSLGTILDAIGGALTARAKLATGTGAAIPAAA